MTDLSPAARAVLKAACIHHGLFNEEIIQRRRMIAAALRAAANTLLNHKYWHDGFWDKEPPKFYRRKLLAIAAELEQLDD